MNLRASIAAAAVASIVSTACTTTAPPHPELPAGTTTKVLTDTLGPPLRVEKHPDGSQTWVYHTLEDRPVTTRTDNLSLPGENVAERDLRHGFEGVTSSASVEWTTVPVEHPLAISPSGHLTTTPRKPLVANDRD